MSKLIRLGGVWLGMSGAVGCSGDTGEYPPGREAGAEYQPSDRGLVRKLGDEDQTEDGGDHGGVEHVASHYILASSQRIYRIVCNFPGTRNVLSDESS